MVLLMALAAFVANVISPVTPTPTALTSKFVLVLLLVVSLLALPALRSACPKPIDEFQSRPAGRLVSNSHLSALLCILRC
jgi:hypothetical protein